MKFDTGKDICICQNDKKRNKGITEAAHVFEQK
jgi:hypothetical protein